MIASIISAILGTLGIAAASSAITDVLNSLGKEASAKIRRLASDINSQLQANEQLLSDFKSASADKKAGIINSMLASSGLGARMESLRRDYNKLVRDEKSLTQQVKAKRDAGNKALSELSALESNASQGVIGMTQAHTADLPNAGDFGVNDPNQNINGGLPPQE